MTDTPSVPPSAPDNPATAKVAKPRKPFAVSLPLYEVLLRDPLGPAARGERRNLLAGSVTVLLVTHVGVIPEKIDSLGIRIGSADLKRLGLVFFCVMAYFMVMFMGYAVADLLARVHGFVERKQAGILEENIRHASIQQQARQGRDRGGSPFGSILVRTPTSSDAAQVISQQFPGIHRVRRVSVPAAVIRGILDFVVPVVIGAWALFALWSFANTEVPVVKPWPPAHPSAAGDSLSPGDTIRAKKVLSTAK